jgi:hypothetical protein
MRIVRQRAELCLALFLTAFRSDAAAAPDSQSGSPQALPSGAERLFVLANRTRASYGLGSLKWDPALAAGALQHCIRMAQEGPISHRYRGEADVTVRASRAGAHFSLIEENVAVGPYVDGIHRGWMNSPDHRANLLNPQVDRVGIAVVVRGGMLYAVADYAHAVPVLTESQVEAAFAGMLRVRGLAIVRDASEARAYCASSGRFRGSGTPSVLMRWKGADLVRLPPALAKRAASGAYREAAVGSCPTQGADGAFTVYRVAVLLYGSDAAGLSGR